MLLKINPDIPKNRLNTLKNPKIISGNILALRKDLIILKNIKLIFKNIYYDSLD